MAVEENSFTVKFAFIYLKSCVYSIKSLIVQYSWIYTIACKTKNVLIQLYNSKIKNFENINGPQYYTFLIHSSSTVLILWSFIIVFILFA